MPHYVPPHASALWPPGPRTSQGGADRQWLFFWARVEEVEHLLHVEFAQLAEIGRVRRRRRLPGSSGARRLHDRVAPRAVPAVEVHPHRRHDDVTALFRQLSQIRIANEIARRALQAVQRDDE